MTRTLLLVVACCLVGVALCRPHVSHTHKVTHTHKDDPKTRAAKLLAQMTLAEKLAMLHGYDGPYVGNVPANTRLNIPALNLNDGPQGFRGASGTSTSFPSALTVAASFDTNLMYAWGEAMGEEFFNKGSNVQLGPGVCLARVPTNGRNFEYLSGEDPFLGYTLVQPVVRGIQSQGVIANAKHFVNNNQETDRGTVSAIVDERTEYEMYFPPFVGASEAGVGSIMCSYNKINGTWSCENPVTLATGYKARMGFEGWVMSDWGATHSTSINAGLDQEMPGGDWMGAKLAAAVASGDVSQAKVDDSVLRILTPMFAVGLFDKPNPNNLTNNVTTDAHKDLCADLSANSTVLLRNEGNLLPLSTTKQKKYALIGLAANPITHGDGSGQVVPPHVTSPLWVLRHRLGLPQKELVANCTPENFVQNTDYFQSDNPSDSAATDLACCLQCASKPDTCRYFSFQKAEKTCWFKMTDEGQKPNNDVTSGYAFVPSPDPPACADGYCVYFDDGTNVESAIATAKMADVAIVFVGTISGEGSDRPNLQLGNGQDDLVEAIASVQKNTVVVVTTPGAVLTPWRYQVPAVLTNFMPGQEVGTAIMNVLFGDRNPAAKLPLTFPNRENEVGFTSEQYPGIMTPAGRVGNYTEGLLVGYRYYDAEGIEPAYPFGHGLSYTTFGYSNLAVNTATGQVSFTLQNTGSVPGAEVPQLYLGYPPSAGEPPKVLRGFHKVELQPGASTTVTFTLNKLATSIWDITVHDWAKVSGVFNVFVGSSSRDIRLTGTMVV